MANKSLFPRATPKVKVADTVNEAGGVAYSLTSQEALAQLAATGCFNNTYYASAESQLDKVLELARKCEPVFVAQTALYARQAGFMKDMPALLLAYLTTFEAGLPLAGLIFKRVIDNEKMLSTFVQIMRSGAVGRKSLGTGPKGWIADWINARSPDKLACAVGLSPPLGEIVALSHPRPTDGTRKALYAYLRGKPHLRADLPRALRQYLDYRETRQGEVPAVPFQMLTDLKLTASEWYQLALAGGWHFTRMNLNTFARHGVFDIKGAAKKIAEKLADPETIRNSRVFPYQLLAAYRTASDVPMVIQVALQDAMELATHNVPSYDGQLVVCPDVSGSMGSPITGQGMMRCVDIAALVSATLLRRNPTRTTVMPFDTRVHGLALNPRDSVMSLSQRIAEYGGGGTACEMPLREINETKMVPDLVLYVSDNESWFTAHSNFPHYTAAQMEWEKLKKRVPGVKLVCINIQPGTTAQTAGKDVLNVGGFSDNVFNVISAFLAGQQNSSVRAIEAMHVIELSKKADQT